MYHSNNNTKPCPDCVIITIVISVMLILLGFCIYSTVYNKQSDTTNTNTSNNIVTVSKTGPINRIVTVSKTGPINRIVTVSKTSPINRIVTVSKTSPINRIVTVSEKDIRFIPIMVLKKS